MHQEMIPYSSTNESVELYYESMVFYPECTAWESKGWL